MSTNTIGDPKRVDFQLPDVEDKKPLPIIEPSLQKIFTNAQEKLQTAKGTYKTYNSTQAKLQNYQQPDGLIAKIVGWFQKGKLQKEALAAKNAFHHSCRQLLGARQNLRSIYHLLPESYKKEANRILSIKVLQEVRLNMNASEVIPFKNESNSPDQLVTKLCKEFKERYKGALLEIAPTEKRSEYKEHWRNLQKKCCNKLQAAIMQFLNEKDASTTPENFEQKLLEWIIKTNVADNLDMTIEERKELDELQAYNISCIKDKKPVKEFSKETMDHYHFPPGPAYLGVVMHLLSQSSLFPDQAVKQLFP